MICVLEIIAAAIWRYIYGKALLVGPSLALTMLTVAMISTVESNCYPPPCPHGPRLLFDYV
eukprot:9196468-Pyramimonas_sp.AAC.1